MRFASPLVLVPAFVLAVFVVAASACSGGSGDEPPSSNVTPESTASTTPTSDASSAPDAGEKPVTSTPTSCFSNQDCPAAQRCESQDDSGEKVYCVDGARGTKAAGEPCTTENDCASALCVESANTTLRCSDLCVTASTCPASLPRCVYIGFGVDASVCAPPAS